MNAVLLKTLAKREAGRLSAKAFRKSREGLEMTQEGLAVALGVSVTAIRDREQGITEVTRKDWLSIEMLKQIRERL